MEPSTLRRPWHPAVLLVVSLLATPLPGGIFHALNYGRLGRQELVRPTLITNLMLGLFIVVLSFKVSIADAHLSAARLLPVLITVIVSAYFYRSQVGLFRALHGAKSGAWWQPALAGVLFSALFLAIGYGIQFLQLADFRKGVAAMDARRYDEAEKFFLGYKKLDPRMTENRFNLAILYAETGRDSLALAELESVLIVNPADEDAKDFMEQLKQREAAR